MKPDAWLLQEFNSNGDVVWSAIMPIRPTDLSWFKDLPTKKHNIVLTPLYADHNKAEKFIGIKSFKESTARLVEAHQGL
jgi:hypothetical protein